MAEPDTSAHHPTESLSDVSGTTSVNDAHENAMDGQLGKTRFDPANNIIVPIYSDPPPYFTEALNDAERLLKYAAEVGVDVDDKTRTSVLKGRLALNSGWN